MPGYTGVTVSQIRLLQDKIDIRTHGLMTPVRTAKV